VGSVAGAIYAFVAGAIVYGLVAAVIGLRLSPEEERRGADLSVHRISANPEADIL
jgi:Amt family ammonium transporter